jgi:hypothetical protein
MALDARERETTMLEELRRDESETKPMLFAVLLACCVIPFVAGLVVSAVTARLGGPGWSLALTALPLLALARVQRRRHAAAVDPSLPVVEVAARA